MKRTEIKRRPLADTVLATLEPDTKEYREHDGIGWRCLWCRGQSKGKEVTYSQARATLEDFLLDHGVSNASVKDSVAAYSLDANETSGSVDSEPQVEKPPMTKPTKTIEVKAAWCNPRADDDCTINGKKVPKAELKQYLPTVYELEVLNAGGHCEYPICYDENDKPVGIN
ncbi:hypothetical protein WEU41_20735 [Pseudomonas fragi]|uniref:hypothetical protein n=1 Tax=Pseudomonas fragi TaxID=296 RepID=UPI0030A7EA36